MLLLLSVALVFGAVAVVVGNLAGNPTSLGFGFEQMIHARIPWLLLGSLAAGCGLAIASLVRRPSVYKYGVLGLELVFAGLLGWYFLGVSFLPEHGISVRVGDPFPAYSLPDQEGRIHTAGASGHRSPTLYIFYRGGW